VDDGGIGDVLEGGDFDYKIFRVCHLAVAAFFKGFARTEARWPAVGFYSTRTSFPEKLGRRRESSALIPDAGCSGSVLRMHPG